MIALAITIRELTHSTTALSSHPVIKNYYFKVWDVWNLTVHQALKLLAWGGGKVSTTARPALLPFSRGACSTWFLLSLSNLPSTNSQEASVGEKIQSLKYRVTQKWIHFLLCKMTAKNSICFIRFLKGDNTYEAHSKQLFLFLLKLTSLSSSGCGLSLNPVM